MPIIKNKSEASYFFHIDGRAIEVPGLRPIDTPDGSFVTAPGVVELDEASLVVARKHPVLAAFLDSGFLSVEREAKEAPKAKA